ncbi:hypothetical protein [Mycoplasma sp. SG1]|uniref:hypothetical protein n=1 Tax=Mycoplasma sp. SG1 TaxID=2810348 RepID=UPI0020259CD9|nr:hypothetical protein [Mycoplasma sp. SG1]URM53208.1 hypothetical protein JRW51_02575 [Mycoplasma sp. SG1]
MKKLFNKIKKKSAKIIPATVAAVSIFGGCGSEEEKKEKIKIQENAKNTNDKKSGTKLIPDEYRLSNNFISLNNEKFYQYKYFWDIIDQKIKDTLSDEIEKSLNSIEKNYDLNLLIEGTLKGLYSNKENASNHNRPENILPITSIQVQENDDKITFTINSVLKEIIIPIENNQYTFKTKNSEVNIHFTLPKMLHEKMLESEIFNLNIENIKVVFQSDFVEIKKDDKVLSILEKQLGQEFLIKETKQYIIQKLTDQIIYEYEDKHKIEIFYQVINQLKLEIEKKFISKSIKIQNIETIKNDDLSSSFKINYRFFFENIENDQIETIDENGEKRLWLLSMINSFTENFYITVDQTTINQIEQDIVPSQTYLNEIETEDVNDWFTLTQLANEKEMQKTFESNRDLLQSLLEERLEIVHDHELSSNINHIDNDFKFLNFFEVDKIEKAEFDETDFSKIITYFIKWKLKENQSPEINQNYRFLQNDERYTLFFQNLEENNSELIIDQNLNTDVFFNNKKVNINGLKLTGNLKLKISKTPLKNLIQYTPRAIDKSINDLIEKELVKELSAKLKNELIQQYHKIKFPITEELEASIDQQLKTYFERNEHPIKNIDQVIVSEIELKSLDDEEVSWIFSTISEVEVAPIDRFEVEHNLEKITIQPFNLGKVNITITFETLKNYFEIIKIMTDKEEFLKLLNNVNVTFQIDKDDFPSVTVTKR